MVTNREQALATLARYQTEIATRFGVSGLAVFGSAARDELSDARDVDVLVEFAGPATMQGYFDLEDYLEALLARTVDLVTEGGLKPRVQARRTGTGPCRVTGCCISGPDRQRLEDPTFPQGPGFRHLRVR